MIYLIALILMFLIWWRCLVTWWDGSALGDRILAALVLTVGQLCFVGFVLGSFGHWNKFFLTLTNLLVSTVVALLSPARREQLISDMVQATTAFTRALNHPVVFAMTLISVAGVGILVWYSQAMPPMSYDGYGYHISKAVYLNMTGYIQPWHWDPELGAVVPGFRGYDDLTREGGFLSWWTDFYPANGSVLMGYVLMFGERFRLVSLVQMPFAFMAALAVYRVVRRVVGGSVEVGAIAGLAVFGAWTVMGQMWYAITDLMMTGLLWAAYALVMVPRDVVVRKDDYDYNLTNNYGVVLSAVAAGLAIGCKLGAGYWALGILILAIWKAVRR